MAGTCFDTASIDLGTRDHQTLANGTGATTPDSGRDKGGDAVWVLAIISPFRLLPDTLLLVSLTNFIHQVGLGSYPELT